MNFALGLSFLENLVVVLFSLVCLAIVLIVLLQKGRGGGIGAAFGGGGGAGSLLGTKTGDFLTWVTICLVASFLVLAVLMGKFLPPKFPGGSALPAAGVTAPEATPTEAAAENSAPDADETATEAAEAAEDIVDEAAAEQTD